MKLRDLLADPPWEKKRSLPDAFPGADAIEVDLGTHPVPITWRAHERERFLGRAREVPALAREQRGMDAKTIEERAVAMTDETDPSDRLSLHVLVDLDDRECARLFNLLPLTAFVSDPASLHAIVARLEARGAVGLCRRSGDMALRVSVFRLLLAIGTPLAAPVLLDAFLRLQSLRGIAKRTMLKFADPLLEAIVPLAAGTPAKNLGLVPIQKPAELVRSARLALHWLSGSGEDAKIARTATKYGQTESIRAVLAEDPLTGLAHVPPGKVLLGVDRPSWGTKREMSKDEWSAFLVWLSLQDWETPRLLSVRTEIEKSSLEIAMQGLFDAFIDAKAPKPWLWIPNAVFELGGREAPRRILAIVRKWKAAFATPAVDTLRAGGLVATRHFGDSIADGILEMLGELAVKASSKSQEQHAQAVIQSIDDELDDVDDLAERLVPSLGLDERGRVKLDYGERQFVARLGTALELHFVDDEGTRLAKLPGALKSDDTAKAKAAKAAMTALGRDARRLVSRVTARMQNALRSQKRWPAPVFELLVVRHPVVGSVARGLVWMAFDEKTGPVTTFNVVEDRTFADVHEKRFELAIGHEVAIAHPALVDAETWSAWTRILGDYEIIQPIPQLGWPLFRLDATESAATENVRFAGNAYRTEALVELGWQRGPWKPDIDDKCTYELVLGGIRAMLFHDPKQSDPYERNIVAKSLRLQKLEETSWDKFLSFSALDPVRTSELFRDLDTSINRT